MLERFALPEVLNYDRMERYRPPCLREHRAVAHFYVADELVARHGDGAAAEAGRLASEAHGRDDAKAAEHRERVRTALVQRSGTVAVVGPPPLVAANGG